MTGILFLDIDGVLLPTRAWSLPANLHALARRRSGATHAEVAADLQLDPVGLALVRRACELSSARIVCCSSWRYSASDDIVRLVLGRHGLGDLLHPDPLPRLSPGHPVDKGREITTWIDDHRTIPVPDRPRQPPFVHAVMNQEEADAYEAWRAADADWMRRADLDVGFRFVVLDDEADTLRLPNGIPTDADAGIGVHDYRAVVRALGGVDPVGGVHALEPDDEARIMGAFGGDYVAAARWLHERLHHADRAQMLMPSRSQVSARMALSGASEASVRAGMRREFEEKLERIENPPRPVLSDEDVDF